MEEPRPRRAPTRLTQGRKPRLRSAPRQRAPGRRHSTFGLRRSLRVMVAWSRRKRKPARVCAYAARRRLIAPGRPAGEGPRPRRTRSPRARARLPKAWLVQHRHLRNSVKLSHHQLSHWPGQAVKKRDEQRVQAAARGSNACPYRQALTMRPSLKARPLVS